MNVWLLHIEPGLYEALVQRDVYMAIHCGRVGVLASALAQTLGLAADELDILGTAARLHDVGKIGIPDSILLKPGPLDAAERVDMRRHSERGERIGLAAVTWRAGLRWLRSSATITNTTMVAVIPTACADRRYRCCRVSALADRYDAMREPRSYHRARPHREVTDILRGERGSRHDPQLVDLMLSLPEAWFARLDHPRQTGLD